MRTVHWLFVVSAALFIFGIAFIVAGAAAAQRAVPAEAPAPDVTPVASVSQIMNGIVDPASTVVFESVSTTVSEAGIEEKAPKTDEEWAKVGSSAAALIEAANLMLMGDRAIDRGDWVTMSRALADAGAIALKATDAKDAMGVLEAGEVINESCNKCHQKYYRQ